MSAADDTRREENARKLAEMLAWDGEPEVYLQHLDDNVQYTAPYYDGLRVAREMRSPRWSARCRRCSPR